MRPIYIDKIHWFTCTTPNPMFISKFHMFTHYLYASSPQRWSETRLILKITILFKQYAYY